MSNKLAFLSVIAMCLSCVVGCGPNVTKRADPTKFSGTIKGVDGKPLKDITIQFLPQFLGSIQTAALVKVDGKFDVDLLPGKYVIMIEPTKNRDAFKSVPAKYHNADKANEMDIVAGKDIEINLTN